MCVLNHANSPDKIRSLRQGPNCETIFFLIQHTSYKVDKSRLQTRTKTRHAHYHDITTTCFKIYKHKYSYSIHLYHFKLYW